jgi:hypothetical protein
VLLAAVYKSPGRVWSDADIIELLNLKHKTILEGDLNAKYPFRNSAVSAPSGEKLLGLSDMNEFEISAPERPTHYFPAVNGDVLDTVVQQNIRLSDVESDIFYSNHLSIVFHIMDHFKARNLQGPVEKVTVWEKFRSLASDLRLVISHRIKMNSEEKADKATRDFSTSIASAYMLSTNGVMLLGLNNDLPGLDHLLKH